MFDSNYSDQEILYKLKHASQMEDWRKNTIELGLDGIIYVFRTGLPEQVQVFLLNIYTSILPKIAPLFTDDVMSAWRAANEMRCVVGMRVEDVFTAIRGYVMMYVRATFTTSKQMFLLYSKAIKVTIKTILQW